MMAVFSIEDRITGWVDDQLAREDPMGGDEWGRHITMAVMGTPQGDAIVWIILITLRGPLLGQDVIGSTTKLAANIPPEKAVRAGITKAVENLRKTFVMQRDGLPPATAPLSLPPGLRREMN